MKVPYLSEETYKKMVENGDFDKGFAIPIGQRLVRGKNTGKFIAAIIFHTKTTFESFFDVSNLQITKILSTNIKWKPITKENPHNEVLYFVAKPLRNRTYNDVGLTVLGNGMLCNPETPPSYKIPILENYNEVKAFEDFLDKEYEFGWI